MLSTALLQADSVTWETPDEVFEELDNIFHFTLDVCAEPETAKCERYFTRDDDGLAQDWTGEVCWMNPPYGRQIGKWLRKAYEESRRGSTVVCLIPARTDTAWWHDWVMRGQIHLIRGRLRFKGAKWNAPFPSAVVVFKREG